MFKKWSVGCNHGLGIVLNIKHRNLEPFKCESLDFHLGSKYYYKYRVTLETKKKKEDYGLGI